MIYSLNETCLKYALWKQSAVITQPDKQLFLFYYQAQHKQWEWSKVSAECPLIFVYFSAICAATAPQCENRHCCYSQAIMLFDNRFQEINSRKTGYGWVIIAPSYWQGLHTDQNLMGFVINSDDSSPPCLAFVGAKQNRRLTFLRLLPIDLAHPTVSGRWERLTSFAFEPVDIHRLWHSVKNEPTGKHLIKCVCFFYVAYHTYGRYR